MSGPRHLTLGLFVLGHGHNVGSWRAPQAQAQDLLNLDYYAAIARTAERGKLDMIFFAEILYGYERNDRHAGELAFPTLDPMVLLAGLGEATERIGLTGTYSTTYTDPAATASKLATLDQFNGGRTGWNIVTSWADQSAANFSRTDHLDKDSRYALAADYVDQVRALWRTAPASPQGHPVLVQAGMSAGGRAFAASVAEVMFTVARDQASARAFRQDIRALVAAHDRAPDDVKVMPGIAPILASTEAEARGKEDEFFELVHPNIQLALLSDQFGLDFSAYRLDDPLPMADILKAPRVLSGARDPSRLIAEVAGRIPTLGEYLRQISRVRAHLSFVGTPDQLADRMADWFHDGACDGFNLMPPVIPGELDILVDELVPALRRRGLFRQDYTAQTLRGHLGLPRGRP